MPCIIVLALTLMLVEALTLYDPGSFERYYAFFVNIPIILDIVFAIVYFVLFYKYLKPLYHAAKERQQERVEEIRP